MQALIDLGIAFIISLQSVGEWLIPPMSFFSYLGTVEFFLLFLPFIYWCVDSALGIRIGLVLMTSEFINGVGKVLFTGPRPYWVDARVRGWWPETSFGIPSGHAQHAVSVWGTVAGHFKQKWIRITAWLLMFFIGFSRLYLGAHFPHDVLMGWLLGGLVLWGFARFWQPVEIWLSGKTSWQKILVGLLASLVMIAVGYGAISLRSGYQVPQEWIDNAMLPEDAEAPNPVDPSDPFTAAGVFFGLIVGAVWLGSQGGFNAAGTLQQRALRYVLGLVGVVIFYFGLKELFPDNGDWISFVFRYIRYVLVGWWVAGGAPWLFKRLRLAEYGAG